MVFFNTCRLSLKLHGNVIVVAGKQSCVLAQTLGRTISSKAMRQGMEIEPKPAPFPYKEKRYNFFRALFDPTTSRLDENSKLIVVDGPPAAGKRALAQELADELDMAYFKSPTATESYILDNGMDLRELDPIIPDSCRSYDENDFLKNTMAEGGSKAARFQLRKFTLRYKRHLEALAHILNTGQGVVMDRCVYSDLVYISAMTETGIVRKNFFQYYHKVRDNSFFALWRPHLVIYLDVPVEETRRRIEARNLPNEKDSKATSIEYLKALENAYKKEYLGDISSHAEVLVYDWTQPGNSEIVVEDIERIDFDKYGVYDNKMKDWRRINKWDWNNSRQKFTHHQDKLMALLSVPHNSIPESLISGQDVKVYQNVLETSKGRYAKGFNTELGDKGVLFKLS